VQEVSHQGRRRVAAPGVPGRGRWPGQKTSRRCAGTVGQGSGRSNVTARGRAARTGGEADWGVRGEGRRNMLCRGHHTRRSGGSHSKLGNSAGVTPQRVEVGRFLADPVEQGSASHRASGASSHQRPGRRRPPHGRTAPSAPPDELRRTGSPSACPRWPRSLLQRRPSRRPGVGPGSRTKAA